MRFEATISILGGGLRFLAKELLAEQLYEAEGTELVNVGYAAWMDRLLVLVYDLYIRFLIKYVAKMCVKILFLREGWLKIETIYAGIGHNLDSNPSWNLYINKKK